MTPENLDKIPKVKAYKKWHLLELYDVTHRTFDAWIKPFQDEIGPLKGKWYTPAQVKIIFDRLGHP